MMAALDEAFLRAWSTFKIPGFNSYQKLAIEKFVIQTQDVLVNLPTGSGKSLIYQALPIVFDSIFKEQGHIVNYIPVSQRIWTPRSISASGFGPPGPYPLADLDPPRRFGPPHKTFLFFNLFKLQAFR